MAKPRCILCEKELGIFERNELIFYWTSQNACAACAKEYHKAEGEALEALSQRILASPHLKERESIAQNMARVEADRKKAEVKKKAQTKFCPLCSTQMNLALQNFSIGADGGGGLATLLADQYVVDLYACPQCGKVELYTAGFIPGVGMENDMVACPVCGNEHHKDVGCPTCAVNASRSASLSSLRSESKSAQKPPWEK